MAVSVSVPVPRLHHGRALALPAGHEPREHAPAPAPDRVRLAAALLALVSEAAAVAAQHPEGDEKEAGNGNADDGAGGEASSATSLFRVLLASEPFSAGSRGGLTYHCSGA